MRKLLLGVVLVVGCGSAEPADKLQGGWIFSPSAESAVGVNFDGAGYVMQLLVLTGPTTGNDQMEKGTFTADGTSITFRPTHTTCPGPEPVWAATYSVTATSLTVTDNATVFLFERNAESAGMGAITLGCFGPNQTFTPAPLAPVSN